MKKKILAIIVSLSLVLMLIPMTATATSSETASTYSELVTALNKSNVTEIVVTKTINIPQKANLDGKGKTVTVPVTGTNSSGIINDEPSDFYVFEMAYSSTIHDLTIKGGGKSAIHTSDLFKDKKIELTNVTITQTGSKNIHGAGLFFNRNTGIIILRNCNIIRNVAEYGGGFCNGANNTLIMDNCTISENRNIGGDACGGGAGENQGNLYLNNCTITNNQSTEIGGAINNKNASQLYVLNSTITGNVSYGSSVKANYGGGIGNNTGKVTVINSIVTNNYISNPGNNYIQSDVAEYQKTGVSTGASKNIDIYNSIIGAYYNDISEIGTPQTNENNIINDNSVNTGLFSGYRNARILNDDGSKNTENSPLSRPIIVKQANGLYTAPLSVNTNTNTEGTNVYFNFVDNTSDIKCGYGTDDNITTLTDSSPIATDKITNFEDGTARSDTTVVGAAPKTEALFYTVYISLDGGPIDGVSIFGETVAYGTTIKLKANPSKTFYKWQTSSDNTEYSDLQNAGSSTLYYTVTNDVYFKVITKDMFNNPIDEEGSNIDVYEETEKDIAVWGKIKPLGSGPNGDNICISVNIAWGNLKYDYSQIEWNSTTLKYENAGWTPTSSGISDKLTVKNRSNVAVDAVLSYANIGSDSLYKNISGEFYDESTYTTAVASNTLNLESAVGKQESTLDQKSAYLKISGAPTAMTDTTDYVKIGTITVNISHKD